MRSLAKSQSVLALAVLASQNQAAVLISCLLQSKVLFVRVRNDEFTRVMVIKYFSSVPVLLTFCEDDVTLWYDINDQERRKLSFTFSELVRVEHCDSGICALPEVDGSH